MQAGSQTEWGKETNTARTIAYPDSISVASRLGITHGIGLQSRQIDSLRLLFGVRIRRTPRENVNSRSEQVRVGSREEEEEEE